MDTTVIYVAYATESLDLSWIPSTATVLVVHNDDSLDPDRAEHPGVRHLRPGRNLGFGAGVNLALRAVTSKRVILCNPDAVLTDVHWAALQGADHELVTVPLIDDTGSPTIVAAPYWTPMTLTGTALRLGQRFNSIGGARRRLMATTTSDDQSSWPLSDRWLSGAVLSASAERLRAVDGFDERFFLYFEDADLCARLARRFPDMIARVADVEPAVHSVGGSAADDRSSSRIEQIRRRSAWAYAANQTGLRWKPIQMLTLKQRPESEECGSGGPRSNDRV